MINCLMSDDEKTGDACHQVSVSPVCGVFSDDEHLVHGVPCCFEHWSICVYNYNTVIGLWDCALYVLFTIPGASAK